MSRIADKPIRNYWRNSILRDLVACRANGNTFRQIAAAYGISAATAYRYCRYAISCGITPHQNPTEYDHRN